MQIELAHYLKNAWNEVGRQYLTGLIPNETVCNFCLCRKLYDELPKHVQLTFDSRVTDSPLYRVDLTIWNREDRTALFLGEVKYWPATSSNGGLHWVKQDLTKLAELLMLDSLHTLTIDPVTGDYDYMPVAVNENTQVGFFFTARDGLKALDHGYLKENFSKQFANRLHIATGTIFNDAKTDPIFTYEHP